MGWLSEVPPLFLSFFFSPCCSNLPLCLLYSYCIKCCSFMCSGSTYRLRWALCRSVHQFTSILGINTSPQQTISSTLINTAAWSVAFSFKLWYTTYASSIRSHREELCDQVRDNTWYAMFGLAFTNKQITYYDFWSFIDIVKKLQFGLVWFRQRSYFWVK